MNIFDVTAEVRSILLQSDVIKNFVGDRLFPVIAPEDTDGDIIVYWRDEARQDYTKWGVANRSVVIRIAAVSESYERSVALASNVYDAISGGFYDLGITLSLEDALEDFDKGKFIQLLDFSIKQI